MRLGWILLAVGLGAAATQPATRPALDAAADKALRIEVAAAIREHRLADGMTIGEANQAMRTKGVKFFDAGWAWPIFRDSPSWGIVSGPRQVGTAVALVADGRIVARDVLHDDHNKADLMAWQRRREGIPDNPMEAAIREHRVLKGMTLAQAEAAMKVDPRLQTERTETKRGDGSKVISWEIWILGEGVPRELGRTVDVLIDDQGIVRDLRDTVTDWGRKLKL